MAFFSLKYMSNINISSPKFQFQWYSFESEARFPTDMKQIEYQNIFLNTFIIMGIHGKGMFGI